MNIINDIPITKAEDDRFDFNNNKVKEVFDFINDAEIRPITVAITGEWGSGKTSLINLLCEKIEKDNKNILIKFEPLLESDLSIHNMMEVFLLKLLGRFKPGSLLIKKILNVLSIGVPSNVSANLSVLKCGSVSIEYNLKEKIKAVQAMKKENTIDKQIILLNKLLEKGKKRLFLIIDEIDRLPAKDTINFLMFTRVLECLTNHVCIIGIDYKHALEKLIAERCIGLITYDIAKQYIDKFFQARFLVKINNHSAVSYIRNILEELDNNKILLNYLDLKNKQSHENLLKIASYLSNIRQIKKWIISIKINYPLLQYLENDDKHYFVNFLAASIKHPIFIDNLNNHVIDKLINERLKNEYYLVNKYGISPHFSMPEVADQEAENIEMDAVVDFEYGLNEALLGMKVNNKNLDDLSKKIAHYPIDENFRSFSGEFLFKSSPYLIVLFLEGYGDSKKISIYEDYFGNDIDDAINTFIASEEKYMDIVVSDIVHRIFLQKNLPNKSASIDKLNEFLYKRNIRNQNKKYFLIFSMCSGDIATVINEGDIYLSAILLENILDIFSPFNKKKSEPKREGTNFLLKDLKYNNKEIRLFKPEEFKTILMKDILPIWFSKFEDLFKNMKNVSSQINLLFTINNYVSWGSLMNQNNTYEEKFTSLFSEYITNNNLDNIQATIGNIIEESMEYKLKINEMEIFNNKSFYSLIGKYLNHHTDIKNSKNFLNLFSISD